jgi:hypothetical protein
MSSCCTIVLTIQPKGVIFLDIIANILKAAVGLLIAAICAFFLWVIISAMFINDNTDVNSSTQSQEQTYNDSLNNIKA